MIAAFALHVRYSLKLCMLSESSLSVPAYRVWVASTGADGSIFAEVTSICGMCICSHIVNDERIIGGKRNE